MILFLYLCICRLECDLVESGLCNAVFEGDHVTTVTGMAHFNIVEASVIEPVLKVAITHIAAADLY